MLINSRSFTIKLIEIPQTTQYRPTITIQPYGIRYKVGQLILRLLVRHPFLGSGYSRKKEITIKRNDRTKNPVVPENVGNPRDTRRHYVVALQRCNLTQRRYFVENIVTSRKKEYYDLPKTFETTIFKTIFQIKSIFTTIFEIPRRFKKIIYFPQDDKREH